LTKPNIFKITKCLKSWESRTTYSSLEVTCWLWNCYKCERAAS